MLGFGLKVGVKGLGPGVLVALGESLCVCVCAAMGMEG